MPKNGSGVYSLPASDVNPPVFNTTIDQVAFAGEMNDIAAALTDCLDRLGRAPMQAILGMAGFRITNVGAPIAQTDAARLADFGGYLPPGAIQDFAMNAAPSGWLVCDGTAYSRTTYASLFAAVGTTWGAGDGSTTFNIPDFRGTSRRTWDNGKGLDPSRVFGSYQADMLASHNHTQSSHSHPVFDPGHSHSETPSSVPLTVQAGSGATVEQPGGGVTGTSTTGVSTNAVIATNIATGGAETVGKNYAILTCIRT